MEGFHISKQTFITVQRKTQKWFWVITFFLLQSCCLLVQYMRMLIIYLKMVHIFKHVFYAIQFRIFEEFSEFEYVYYDS